MATINKLSDSADMRRLRELAAMPALFDQEIAELGRLAAGLGLLVTVERIDLAADSRSRYTLGAKHDRG